MIVSLKHEFVFLCMPKCASTSTEAVLRPFGQLVTDEDPYLKHTNYRSYERFVRPFLLDRPRRGDGRQLSLEVVCLFREPIDWVHSWYRYRTRPGLAKKRPQNSTAGISFEEFAKEYVSPKPRPFARIGRQAGFVWDTSGQVGAIKLFRYEKYDAFLKFMSNKIGMDLNAPRLNVSPRGEDIDKTGLGFLVDYLAEEYKIYAALG